MQLSMYAFTSPFSHAWNDSLSLALGASVTGSFGALDPLAQLVSANDTASTAIILDGLLHRTLHLQCRLRVIALLCGTSMLVLLPGFNEGLDDSLDEGFEPAPHGYLPPSAAPIRPRPTSPCTTLPQSACDTLP